MKKYSLLLLLGTFLFSINSFAMNEEPMEIEQRHSHSVQLNILEEREFYLIPKTTTLVQGRRTAIKGFGKRSTPQSINKKFTSKISEIKDDPSLENLADAVYIASFADDASEKVDEAYKVFINSRLETDPYKLLVLLGYHDIQIQISSEHLQKLNSYKYEEAKTLKDYYIRQQANDSLHRHAVPAAFIYAHEKSIPLDAQACLLTNILKSSRNTDSIVTPQELLNFVANSSISTLVRVHAYFVSAYYEISLQPMNHGLSLLPKDHQEYGAFLAKRNQQCLSLGTNKYTEQELKEFVTSLEEESGYLPLDRNKVEFLVSHAEKQGDLTKALSYFKDEQKLTTPYVKLLVKAQKYEEAYEILKKIKQPGHFYSECDALWLFINWMRKDFSEFDVSLCKAIESHHLSHYMSFDYLNEAYLRPIADEVMESEISPELKAHFAYVYNVVNPLGLELASQFHHIQDPVLRIFVSLPLFYPFERNISDAVFDDVLDVLVKNREVVLAGLPRLFNDEAVSKLLLHRFIGFVRALSKKYEETEHSESLRSISQEINEPQEAPKPEEVNRKRLLETPEEKQKDKKRLKRAFTDEDPRRNWRYDAERINSGSCNATEEHLAGYKAVFDFIEGMIKEGHISEAQAYKSKIVTKGYQILHTHNAAICRELIDSPTLKNYSDRYHVQRSRDIILHPENTEANLESRAQNFYNILMAAFEFVRESNDVALQVKFVTEAFSSHIPCFEARSRAMDQWRESNVKNQLGYLQTHESISIKDAQTNICDVAHALLERMEFEVPEVKSMKRIESLKGLLIPQTNNLSKEVGWALVELQKRIENELEDNRKQTETYRNIALELQTLLVGKQALDKIIDAFDINRVLRTILSWDLPELLHESKPMETEEM